MLRDLSTQLIELLKFAEEARSRPNPDKEILHAEWDEKLLSFLEYFDAYVAESMRDVREKVGFWYA